MRFASLGSGSRGNATLVQSGDTLLMVDCGFSTRETVARMDRLGVAPQDLAAILVTHEHTDHCSGVARLSRKYQLPVYLTRGTYASGRCEDPSSVVYFHSEEPFSIGDIVIEPLAVPHDAREPCQFVLRSAECRLGILTDLGSITPAVVAHYQGCQGLLLECNHDWTMLQNGPYPPSLISRVGGDWGHLNNEQSAALLARLDHSLLQQLVIAHISEKNNCRDQVQLALAAVYQGVEEFIWADQALGFDWLALKP